jgi:hypothetical protein
VKRAPAASRRQQGAALMVIAALLILGISWFAVAALSRSSVASYEREVITARSLQMAKDALLSYVAHYAARTNHNFPGRMPCPESLSAIGTANEGEATGACSNTLVEVGRLPWKTIGMEPLTDGDNERLWYVLSPNFHPVTSPPVTALNFDTPAALPFDGANVVALIIAPGKPLNTVNDSDTPPGGCAKVAQGAARFASPLDPAKFFECGNATGAYANLGKSQWTNDRAIAITQAEWANAIAGPVADRLQRQVAPVLADWDQFQQTAAGKSWGATWGLAYLPYASTFGDPAANDYCGNNAAYEGLAPLALTSPAVCDTRWTGVSGVLGGLLPLGCTQQATYLSCSFLRVLGLLLPVNITATAANVGNGYRGTMGCPLPYSAATCDIALPDGGAVTSMTMALSSAGTATTTVQVLFPLTLGLLSIAEVRIPYLPDAQFLTNAADPSGAYQATLWFRHNNWQRYTYYVVARSETPAAATPCAAQGDLGCVEVRGLDATTGTFWNKRLALVLAGPALASQNRAASPGVLASYFEEHNASTGDRVFRSRFQTMNPDPASETPAVAPPYPAFNDRLAVCPFRQVRQDGTFTDLCS